MESNGRPDDTWTEAQKAEYERLKAECLADRAEITALLDQPTVSADDLMEVLDRLLEESRTRGAKA